MNEPHMKQPSKTDWERLDHLTDDEIDISDSPPLDQSFFKRASLHTEQGKTTVLVQVDEDVLAWFRAQGPEYVKRMNAALRIYAEAHKEAA